MQVHSCEEKFIIFALSRHKRAGSQSAGQLLIDDMMGPVYKEYAERARRGYCERSPRGMGAPSLEIKSHASR